MSYVYIIKKVLQFTAPGKQYTKMIIMTLIIIESDEAHRYWWVSSVQNGSEFIFTTWVLLLKYDLNHEMCMIFLFFYLKFLCKTLWGEMSKKFWFCWLRGSISISHLSLAPSATTFYHSNLHVRLVPGSICSLNPPHAWWEANS